MSALHITPFVAPAIFTLLSGALLAPRQALSATAPSELYVYALAMYTDEKRSTANALSAQKEWSSDGGSMSATSQAEFGVLRVRSEANAAAKGGWNLLANGSQAYWADTMTISAPGLQDQQGTVTVKFRIDGTLRCSGGGDESRASYAAAEFELYRDDWLVRSASQWLYYDGRQSFYRDEQPTNESFLGKAMAVDVGFTFGKPFRLKLFVSCLSRAYQYQGAMAAADLSHTATWGGFASVKNNQGQTVANYTLGSATGVNFAAPVGPPVPMVSVSHAMRDIALSWSTNFSTMRLEEAETPAGPWSTVVSSPAVQDGRHVVTIPNGHGSRFFRLAGQ